jgi:hypothetical protein
MVATQLAGHVEIDEGKLREDLRIAAGFSFSEAYSDYVCGGPWKSCMIWASGGDNGDGLVTHYDHGKAPSVTGYGEHLPYLRHLVETNFRTEHLNFARLAIIEDSVTFPHRDLLELKDVPQDARNSHRVHIPLVTNDHCLFTEDDVVYRMLEGDVWFFDSARIHGAGSLSREPRTHLILDFTEAGRDDLARFELKPSGTIPEDRIVPRDPVSESDLDALVRLADLVSMDNFRDVASIVIKTHYRKDGGPDFVWSTLERIAQESDSKEVREKISELHEFFVIDRSA